jgi:hypothetical protein
VDVLQGTDKRNSVLELDGPKTLREFLSAWPESAAIWCDQGVTGVQWLQRNGTDRVHVAFIDGKHSHESVSQEAALLAKVQKPGDLVIFDDVQIEGVAQAIAGASKSYEIEYLDVLPTRRYGLGVRRG